MESAGTHAADINVVAAVRTSTTGGFTTVRELEVPKHLSRRVHDLYFDPQHEEFAPRTMWTLSNAFTSAFKELDPIPQFRATARLGESLKSRCSQAFYVRRHRPGHRFVYRRLPIVLRLGWQCDEAQS